METLRTRAPGSDIWTVWVPERQEPGTDVLIPIQVMDTCPVSAIDDVENVQVWPERVVEAPTESNIDNPFLWDSFGAKIGDDGLIYVWFRMIPWNLSIHLPVWQDSEYGQVFKTSHLMHVRPRARRKSLSINVLSTHFRDSKPVEP